MRTAPLGHGSERSSGCHFRGVRRSGGGAPPGKNLGVVGGPTMAADRQVGPDLLTCTKLADDLGCYGEARSEMLEVWRQRLAWNPGGTPSTLKTGWTQSSSSLARGDEAVPIHLAPPPLLIEVLGCQEDQQGGGSPLLPRRLRPSVAPVKVFERSIQFLYTALRECPPLPVRPERPRPAHLTSDPNERWPDLLPTLDVPPVGVGDQRRRFSLSLASCSPIVRG